MSEVSAHDAHGHDPAMAHHFDTPEQQRESGKLGMWVFLATEVLLFGGLFVAYAVYRSNHPEIFVYAHRFLNKGLGGLNTIVLICSSLSMAWAVRAAQLGQRKLLVGLLITTLACAGVFLGVKSIEYQNKWKEGLLWGRNFKPTAEALESVGTRPGAPKVPAVKMITPMPQDRSAIPPAAVGPGGLAPEATLPGSRHELFEKPENVQIFFGIYFIMTGLHGLHVLGGMGAIGWILLRSLRGDFSSRYFTPVDLVGLYWHLVDLIWIFLFPLLYLIH
jgi:cytochrome c oxidase subunit 3